MLLLQILFQAYLKFPQSWIKNFIVPFVFLYCSHIILCFRDRKNQYRLSREYWFIFKLLFFSFFHIVTDFFLTIFFFSFLYFYIVTDKWAGISFSYLFAKYMQFLFSAQGQSKIKWGKNISEVQLKPAGLKSALCQSTCLMK